MNPASPTPPNTPESRCPQCGAPLVPGALGGLCPACLLKQGVTAETNPGEAPRGFEPPSVSELAPLFPQLEIIEFVGKGGMGAVYKARQKELDRVVALKILPPGMGAAPGFAERFAREAKALAKLNHPGIVTIHEFGRADALFYFLMEFVDGVNLRQLLAGGRISPREALAIVPEICDALQFAHDHGIVHRDIKPANILLDRRGRVKVADFGLAKLVEAGMEAAPAERPSAADPTLTEAGKVMGTPSYMAPEQTDQPGQVDHRADIYSLGVVFYELLTGELPDGKLPLPSRKVHVDVRLDEVVLRTLEKKPDLRYQQASHVKAAVETITGNDPPLTTAAHDEAFVRESLAREYTLDIGSCLRRAWALVKSDFWPLVGITALILALIGAAASVGNSAPNGNGEAGSLLYILLNGPLMGGLYLHFLKKIRGEPTSVETAFSGFSKFFLHLFLGGFVTAALITLGFFCLILPGIYLMVAWIFTLPLIIDKRLHFWSAMELSRKMVTRHWFHFFAFAIVLFLLSLAGFLALIVGIFIAAPVVVAALMYAYEDIFATEGATSPATGAAFTTNAPATGPLGTASGKSAFGFTSSALKPVTWIVLAAIAATAFFIWIAAPRAGAKRSAPRKIHVYGPVVERMIDANTMAQGIGLDIDSGNTVTSVDWTPKSIAEQLRGQRADLYFDPGTREWRALEMSAAAQDGDGWEASPEEVQRTRWKRGASSSPVVLVPGTSYFILSREGAMGVLQMVGQPGDASSVKIRYKLLEKPGRVTAGNRSAKPGRGNDQFSTSLATPLEADVGAPTFGPTIQRVVHDIDEKAGKECLVIESGELLDFNESQIKALPKSDQQKWFADRQVNLLMDTVGGQRGVGLRDVTLTKLPAAAWERQSADGIEQSINPADPGVEFKDAGGFRWHMMPANAALPLTFAFRTASEKVGLLQITGFGDKPGRATLRYKLLKSTASSP